MNSKSGRRALAAVLLCATTASARAPGNDLSRDDASRRAILVKDPDYDLALTLDSETKEFTGKETARFTLAAPAGELTMDFAGGKIESLTVNGARVENPDPASAFFLLPKKLLRAGENVVALAFTHPYSVDGAGLVRFADPEDGRVYLYTNLEPYDAHRLFACFDQPDLKASVALTVDAPAAWRVVSASPEDKIETAGARRTWTFGRTPRLSPYVFSVDAGPYRVWTSSAGDVPLRLFARESMAQYVPAGEWLELTRQGLAFYGDYFHLPYPFKKYDQLLVPDFGEGAMENAAAATFGEYYVVRSTPTLEKREELAVTILHEMAHMWFGDLVTMRWWDGLWLNESFATQMSELALAQATRYRRAWLSFFAEEKLWAYGEDQRRTTHPVEGEVADTSQAFASFDGITYGKGAAALKQLAYRLGEDKFRDGVRLYLKDHAYGNAEEKDFFGALERTSGADLGGWTREWLETAGVNTVRADYTCGAGGRVSSFALAETAPADFPTLRRHRADVALYAAGPGGWVLQDSVAVDYGGGRTEVPALAGRPCPVFVFPNLGDEDYAKPELDGRSLAAAKAAPENVPDPLTRAMTWNALWELVRDASWPAQDYADLVLKTLGSETDYKVARSVLLTVYGQRLSSPSVLNYLEKPDYPRFEDFFAANLAKAEPGGDFQKLWFDGFVKVASSPAGAERLRGFLSGADAPAGLDVDQDRRWQILARLSELGAPDAEALIRAEGARDASDLGAKAALTARAAAPDPARKKAWFSRIADPNSPASLGDLRAAMADFFPRTQRGLRAEFVAPFFETLPGLAAEKTEDFLLDYTQSMIPVLCTADGVAGLEAFLKKSPLQQPLVLRALRDARQEDERCVRVRALARVEQR